VLIIRVAGGSPQLLLAAVGSPWQPSAAKSSLPSEKLSIEIIARTALKLEYTQSITISRSINVITYSSAYLTPSIETATTTGF
jgi:hypothetical protein